MESWEIYLTIRLKGSMWMKGNLTQGAGWGCPQFGYVEQNWKRVYCWPGYPGKSVWSEGGKSDKSFQPKDGRKLALAWCLYQRIGVLTETNALRGENRKPGFVRDVGRKRTGKHHPEEDQDRMLIKVAGNPRKSSIF